MPGPPPGLPEPLPGFPEGLEEPLPDEPRDVASDAALPGDKRLEVELSELEKGVLGLQIQDILDAHEQAIGPRKERWKTINQAFYLVPDSKRTGISPNASQLVSELTRVHVGNAASRVVGAMLDVQPLVQVLVSGAESGDQETRERLEEAEATTNFFDSYKRDMDLERVIPDDIHRASRIGTSITRIMWEPEVRVTKFVTRSGEIEEEREDIGRIVWTLIPNENFVLWPHTITDIQKAKLTGHRSFWVPSDFERYARHTLHLDQSVIDEVLGRSKSNESDPVSVEKARQKDIDLAGENPFHGEVRLFEAWISFPVPGHLDEEDPRYQVIYHEDTRKVLYVGENPLYCRLHPYWDSRYLREDELFWGTGAGDEVMWNQAAGSAGLNLLVDNFKIVSNYIRLIKSGSPIEANIGNIEPGKDYSVDDVEGDFKVVELGGPLDNIYQFLQDNEARAARNSGITPPLMGMADPTMKSGASASAHTMLVSEAQRKFGQVDRNFRDSYTRKLMFVLQLLQQYAPEGLWYEVLDAKNASKAARIKYRPPTGRLDRIFRLEVQAPSAATNKEQQKTSIQTIYMQAQQHIQMLLQLGMQLQQTPLANPAGLMRLTEESMQFMHDLFKRILQLHDIPGVKPPEPGPPTPPEQVINQLLQQLQQLQQQAQQLAAQLQQEQQKGQAMQQQMQAHMQAMQGGGMGMPGGAM